MNLSTGIWDNFKKYTGLALLFLGLGAGGIVVAGKNLSEVVPFDLVPRNSYIYKSDIDKTHVPIERFKEVAADLKLTKKQNGSLKKQLLQSQASQSNISRLACRNFTQEKDEIIAERKQTEEAIEGELSFPSILNREIPPANLERVQQFRKRKEDLNQQLAQVTAEYSKCI